MFLVQWMIPCHMIKVVSILLILTTFSSTSFADSKVYIVRLRQHNLDNKFQPHEDHYLFNYLQTIKGSLEEAKASIVYSYTKVIYGFSALLTPAEVHELSDRYGVISVVESKSNELQTSRSWDFITLFDNDSNPIQANRVEDLMSRANLGTNVVVGVLDTGIWPESQSFSDFGMDPIPETWRGRCLDLDVPCNRKLIGARSFPAAYEAKYGPVNPAVEYRLARDSIGHGTHVASIIGGRQVDNGAAVGGFGAGGVRSGAPVVRLAVYKVCWKSITGLVSCEDSDILAGFDAAINDGVDVINLSHGGMHKPYTQDANAVGSLQAALYDIPVAAAAGNAGPNAGTVANVAPWAITVAASSIDRVFESAFLLGNGYQYQGQSITPLSLTMRYGLVYAGNIEIPGSTTPETTGQCCPGTLLPNGANGRAVLCLRGIEYNVYPGQQASEVQRAGGAAALLQNPHYGIGVSLQRFPIPTVVVLSGDIDSIRNYILTTQYPTVTLSPPTTQQPTTPAPFMAEFSSTGPNMIENNLLKPDVTAPGLNILAASTEARSRDDKFVFMSGTSFASPHVAAVLALLKATHPDWSNAAMISAIMTTAKVTDTTGNPITDATLQNRASPFNYGSGHIRPLKAVDPGLVYDIHHAEYLNFACASTGVSLDSHYTCPATLPSPSNLNYPSLAIADVGSEGTTVIRRVKNVGGGSPEYTVTIDPPPGYTVRISPTSLSFLAGVEQTRTFTITVRPLDNAVRNMFVFGSYTWFSNDGFYEVRSPMAVSTRRVVRERVFDYQLMPPFQPLVCSCLEMYCLMLSVAESVLVTKWDFNAVYVKMYN
ncbi:subtilisin-like protease SBT5.6 isoform X2 [Andrographis paniculata]|uniref:subtilisin-like protease SBT5.6 isoform X2 n=1 Tax=Andrographis paniculata TaxID=175694 RepID=UPI0021E922EB|nr:subtilisin-like protease SBT5.6 isoform X2 [Andrographis paniculata]